MFLRLSILRTTIVGKVKDMSLGGAAFEFIGSGVDESKQFGRYSLDVFMLGSSGAKLNMPCKIFFREPPLRAKTAHMGFFPGLSATSVWRNSRI